MNRTEIFYSKKLLYPMIVLLVLGLTGSVYVAFFTEHYKGSEGMIWKLVSVVVDISLVSTLVWLWRRLKTNKPYLTFTDQELIYQKNQPVAYKWEEILEWKLVKEADNSAEYHLLIKTADKEQRIALSWLDKSPNEVEDLMKRYT